MLFLYLQFFFNLNLKYFVNLYVSKAIEFNLFCITRVLSLNFIKLTSENIKIIYFTQFKNTNQSIKNRLFLRSQRQDLLN